MKNRKRNRMQGFDYSSENLYFVTICVKDRKCCFGSVIPVGTGRDLSVRNSNAINSNAINSNAINSNAIDANEINPNDIYSNTNNPNEINPNAINSNTNNSNGFTKRMELNKFGRIVHDKMLWLAEQYQYVELHNFVVMPNHVHAIIGIVGTGRVRTGRDLSLRDISVREIIVNQNEEIKIKSLSSLMGAFKTTSSKMIHQEGLLDFAWQRSFHDHIIRNEKSYLNISNYIDSNPERWAVDTFFENN